MTTSPADRLSAALSGRYRTERALGAGRAVCYSAPSPSTNTPPIS